MGSGGTKPGKRPLAYPEAARDLRGKQTIRRSASIRRAGPSTIFMYGLKPAGIKRQPGAFPGRGCDAGGDGSLLWRSAPECPAERVAVRELDSARQFAPQTDATSQQQPEPSAESSRQRDVEQLLVFPQSLADAEFPFGRNQARGRLSSFRDKLHFERSIGPRAGNHLLLQLPWSPSIPEDQQHRDVPAYGARKRLLSGPVRPRTGRPLLLG